MSTFKTNLKLGGKAYAVRGHLDFHIECLTVGQITVTETLPSARFSPDNKCYVEKCMCLETGIGSGNIWEYDLNIFTNEADAQRGVISHQQRQHKERAKRDAYQADQAATQRRIDLLKLQELRNKYGSQENHQ